MFVRYSTKTMFSEAKCCRILIALLSYFGCVRAQCEPHELQTSGIMPMGLTITWKCSNVGLKSEFRIAYKYSDQCSSEDATLMEQQYTAWGQHGQFSPIPDPEFNVLYSYSTGLSELFPSSDYTFWIESRVQSGNGYIQSDELTFTTSDTAPTVSPINVTVPTMTDTSVSFSWNPLPCTQENGQNFRYAYSLREVLSNTYLKSDLTTETRVTIGNINLECNVNYEFQVAAVNDEGSSPAGGVDFSPEYGE
ncbi:uncharacterized protein [Amphiura filiformis]|uniref:uncharacterized protein n=1 Tax=Amphiura filiformis TaxID=82378 RepID=UPI003B21A2EA